MARQALLRTAVVLLAVILLATAAAGGVDAAGQPVDGLQTAGIQTADNQSSGADRTPLHENPDEATEDDEGMEEHLESVLADRLADATDDTVDGDHEDARELLDEAYDDQLDEYAEVAGDERAEAYDDAQSDLQTFIDTNERFDDRREAYREAREDGEVERADELQAGLQDDANDIDESSDELISSYRRLDELTGIDHSEEIEQIENRQQAVDGFVSETDGAGERTTVLLVENERSAISFDEPARINGQLLTADGEPVADREITVAVEGRPYSVETDSAGQFEISHRPVESVGETTLDIAYQPAETSEYRAAQREIPVQIEPVDATVQIESTESASFERELSTEGRVVAGSQNQPAADVPVGLFLDGEELETTDTDEDGEFSVSTAIPRSVDSGTAEIEVRTLEADGAIDSASETGEIRIEPVSTSLSVETDTEATTGEDATIDGQLETADGQPVADATVDLAVDGEPVETVSTDDDGAFEATLALPEADDDSVTITASADTGDSHLQPSTETITLEGSADADVGVEPSPPQQESEPSTLGAVTRELLFVGGSLLALFGLVGLWWVRRTAVSPETATGEPLAESTASESTASEPAESAGAESPASTPARSSQLQSLAEQQLAAGTYDHAVVLAYAAVRRRLGSVLRIPDSVTHRELAHSYAAAVDDHDQREPVETVTREYERVRYAADSVDESAAARAVSTAEQLLDEIEQPDHDGR